MEYQVTISNDNLETAILESNPSGDVVLNIYKDELEEILKIALRNDCDVLIRKIETTD